MTKEEILKRMEEIQKKYGQISDIPISSDYWHLANQLRKLEHGTN